MAVERNTPKGWLSANEAMPVWKQLARIGFTRNEIKTLLPEVKKQNKIDDFHKLPATKLKALILPSLALFRGESKGASAGVTLSGAARIPPKESTPRPDNDTCLSELMCALQPTFAEALVSEAAVSEAPSKVLLGEITLVSTSARNKKAK